MKVEDEKKEKDQDEMLETDRTHIRKILDMENEQEKCDDSANQNKDVTVLKDESSEVENKNKTAKETEKRKKLKVMERLKMFSFS